MKFGLSPPVAAAAEKHLALLLKLGQPAPRIFDARIHVDAFRAPHEPATEDEETVEAAGVLHGRLRPLEHAVGLGDLLIDAAEFIAVRSAAALRGGELFLELHAADLLLADALRQASAGAGDKAGTAEREQAETCAGRPQQ